MCSSIILGGLGVNKTVENMSPHSPVNSTFKLHAKLTTPNPPNTF
jgi:hypothetical protein